MDLLAVKRRFDLPELHCLSGATISNVAVGYETYGELNAARDTAILIAFFLRLQPCGGQICARRRPARLLGRHRRARQGGGHQSLFRDFLRYAG